MLPALVVFGVFVVAPMIDGAWISLFAWDGVTVGHWVGLSNYREALVDPLVREAFGHSLVLVGFYAVAADHDRAVPDGADVACPGAGQHRRSHHHLPAAGAGGGGDRRGLEVAVRPARGRSTRCSARWGSSSLEHSWLGDFSTALPAVGVIGTWVTTGLCLVLFVAGVQRIPLSRYEAARVDGAGPVREFFAVTLPGLRNELAVAMSLSVITALRAFDIIFVTTKGGPGTATTVPSLLIYQRAFITGEVGSAAAIGAIMGAIILLFRS